MLVTEFRTDETPFDLRGSADMADQRPEERRPARRPARRIHPATPEAGRQIRAEIP